MTTPLPPTEPSTADEPLPGEAELAALYRQLPRNEPGPALDAAVLRAAAHALSAGDKDLPEGMTERRKLSREKLAALPATSISAATSPTLQSIEYATRARRQRAPRWPIALGSAASLVLVAGLAWHMRETTPPVSAPAPQRVSMPMAASSKPVSESRAPAAPAPMLRQVQSAAQPAPEIADAPAMMTRKKSAARSIAPPTATGNSADSSPPAVAEASVDAKAAAPRQAEAPQALGGIMTHADRAAPPPMPAPVAEPGSQTMSAAPVPSAGPSEDAERDASAQAGDTPAQELDKISQLFAQGHDAEALQRLRIFQQAHPQWPLPAALRARLGQP